MGETDISDNAKILAVASHGGTLIGIPLLWILPMITRDDEFALFHAKQAGALAVVGLIATIVITLVSVVTCGLGAVLYVLLLALPLASLFGIYDILVGQKTRMPLVSDVADLLFASITVKDS